MVVIREDAGSVGSTLENVSPVLGSALGDVEIVKIMEV